MPVRKFHSIEQMSDDATSPARDTEELWRAIKTAWAWASYFAPPEFPPGVHKHRTIAAWNAQTDAWEREAIDRARQRKRDLADADSAPG